MPGGMEGSFNVVSLLPMCEPWRLWLEKRAPLQDTLGDSRVSLLSLGAQVVLSQHLFNRQCVLSHTANRELKKGAFGTLIPSQSLASMSCQTLSDLVGWSLTFLSCLSTRPTSQVGLPFSQAFS